MRSEWIEFGQEVVEFLESIKEKLDKKENYKLVDLSEKFDDLSHEISSFEEIANMTCFNSGLTKDNKSTLYELQPVVDGFNSLTYTEDNKLLFNGKVFIEKCHPQDAYVFLKTYEQLK